jgi:hypothetical protein
MAGRTSAGAWWLFQKHRYRDARRLAAVTPRPICFHILHRLSAGSRGVNLQKALPKGNSYTKADFYPARSELSEV